MGSVIEKLNNWNPGILLPTRGIYRLHSEGLSLYLFLFFSRYSSLRRRINQNASHGNLESITLNRSSILHGERLLNRAGGEQRTKVRGKRERQLKYPHEKMKKRKRKEKERNRRTIRSNRTRIILSAVLSTRKLIGLVFACLNYR